jgi:hypothetical protein
MSGASNLGYGKITPLSNINGNYVNKDNSNYSGNFSSNEVSSYGGLVGAKLNTNAAAGIIGGYKRKIKNISKYYKKMKGGSRKMKSVKRRIKHRLVSRKRRGRRTRVMKGGYSQYQNNMPYTPSYQVAGVHLPASQLALANPPPFTKIGGNCVDNYNHYTNMGFPSKGH